MKLGHYKSGGLEVTLTPHEIAILGADAEKGLKATIAKSADKDWLRIEPGGDLRLGQPRQRSGSRSFRFRPPGGRMQNFGAETVVTTSPGPGVLFGHKPRMNIPLIVRTNYPKNRKGSKLAAVAPEESQERLSFQCVHDAVKIINNFSAKHQDLELAITQQDGVSILVVRMYIEFGK